MATTGVGGASVAAAETLKLRALWLRALPLRACLAAGRKAAVEPARLAAEAAATAVPGRRAAVVRVLRAAMAAGCTQRLTTSSEERVGQGATAVAGGAAPIKGAEAQHPGHKMC